MNGTVSGKNGPGSGTSPDVDFDDFARTATRRHVTPPLILSAAIAVALVASFLSLAMRPDGGVEAALHPLIDRFFGNGFSRTIVIVFLTAALYGVLQLIGVVVDRERLPWLGKSGGKARSDREARGLLRALSKWRPRRQHAEGGAGAGGSADREAHGSWLALLAGRLSEPTTGLATMAGKLSGDPRDYADRYSLQRDRNAELGLLPLRFSVWVLPLLGFIGTVVGIARSIVGLEAVIAPPGAGGQSAEGLMAVLGGLQFAFDTTLLGLVTAIPIMLLQVVLGGRENEATEESRHRVLTVLASAKAGKGPAASGQDAVQAE